MRHSNMDDGADSLFLTVSHEHPITGVDNFSVKPYHLFGHLLVRNRTVQYRWSDDVYFLLPSESLQSSALVIARCQKSLAVLQHPALVVGILNRLRQPLFMFHCVGSYFSVWRNDHSIALADGCLHQPEGITVPRTMNVDDVRRTLVKRLLYVAVESSYIYIGDSLESIRQMTDVIAQDVVVLKL